MNVPIDLMVNHINSSEQCQAYLTTKYPYEYEIWTRFSKQNGGQCGFARAAIRRIFQFEFKEFGGNFITTINNETWGAPGG